jgi:phage terminase large subunit-like protein
LAAARILEHDKWGALCWREWMLTLARQGGKSWLMSELAMWRILHADLFDDGPQLVMHVADKLQTGDEVQRYHRAWAKAHRDEGWTTSEQAGARSVVSPDDSRWRVFSKDTPYGWSAGLALIDEVWALHAAIVEDGIEPTQIERTQPQLGLLSTAHPRATSLFIDRRATALAGGSILLLEWSAPSYLELQDRQGWRMASPHWSEQRELTVERALQRALASRSSALNEQDPIATFRGQYLNQWPQRATNEIALPGDSLFPADTWRQLAGPADPVGPVTFAVEDFAGIAVAVAAAGRDASGTITLEAYVLSGDRRTAYDWIALHSASRPGSSLVVGASLQSDAAVIELGASLVVQAMTYADTRAALSLLRQVVNRRGLVHADSPELDGQIRACRVAEGTAGLRVASTARWDVIRAAAWAVGAVERERRNAPQVY